MRFLKVLLVSSALSALPAHAQVQRPVQGTILVLCEEKDAAGNCASSGGTGWLDSDRITVLANGMWERRDRAGQSISVLDRHDLEQAQGPDIARALQRMASVSLTRNGGLGSFTGLSVRGAASERVLVLVDGVRMNDVAGPAGGFDFGSVTTGSIERVELLRGSGSLVWGSDALGGVVHMTTLVPDGLEASGEYGGDGQFAGNVALGQVDTRGLSAGIGASYVTRDGFSAAESGTEDDGFEQLALSARGEARLGGPVSLFASARYAEGETEIDGFPAPAFTLADTAERQDMRQLSGRAGLELSNGYDRLVTLSLGHGETRRELVDEALSELPYYVTDGRSTRAEMRSRLGLSDDLDLVAGGDWDWSRFTDGSSRAETDSGSGHAMLAWTLGKYRNAQLTGGLRFDRHRDFGSAWTFAANGYVELDEGMRLRAAYGEGFKAPSLFQLHSDYGNAALQPERSRSYEVGLDLFEGRSSGRRAGITIFRRDSSDLIDFTSCFGSSNPICADRPFGTYDNIGRARSQGVEVEGGTALGAGFEAGLAYAYIESKNRDTGLRLARRPRHAGTLSFDWSGPEGHIGLGADLRVVSATFDDTANTVHLPGHAVLDLRAEWQVSDRFTLHGRVENAWDEQYQTAAGYATQGRAAFIGARARL
ncbi:TonB-dependent receptor plug domain-containing protein [Alteraurantiacibacter aquimixticola]|uniref:TonB-dependent receptor n=1 Tax=Alteraurantiacibacter aquimixticola TaxID=2489173 RepID=A0A4T3F047_9SPHN|nr:TonB-dependent receptor [Alteraurantiacibacter aquimixticola]TIX50399.1 TonB-dependent receptor [Alteraurantiacibacter aquimixticola]